jgi:3-oxoacyl-[acyl-carrier-protein] synthase-3
MNGKISQIEVKLPRNKISVKQICIKNKWDYPKIFEKTGIKYVYHSSKKESALNLAISAGKKLIRKNKNIDALIYVTQSPEFNLPTNACVIQNKLGLKKNIIAYDLNQGCTGFIYGLYNAQLLFEDNFINNVLVICSDTYTKNINKNNKSCLTLFSDGATAILLKKSKTKKNQFIFYTDGSGENDLKLYFSGNQIVKNKKPDLFMDGRKVLMFTMNTVPKIIKKTLKENKITVSKLKYILFHQASKIVIDNLIRKMNLPQDKVYKNYDKYGNTVSSTIPLCLHDMKKKQMIKKGDKILICGFGVGLSVASTIMEI